MKQDLIVILDMGSTNNTVLAREVRDLGVYSEIHPHDITVDELKALKNVKGIVLNGGENRVVEHFPLTNLLSDQLHLIFNEVLHIPICLCAALLENKLFQCLPIRKFHKLRAAFRLRIVYRNHRNAHIVKLRSDLHFLPVNHAVFSAVLELIRQQVGERKVLLALSGGVDSSVVAAMLIKAIGQQLVCVHVNHGLMRKNESRSTFRSPTCCLISST